MRNWVPHCLSARRDKPTWRQDLWGYELDVDKGKINELCSQYIFQILTGKILRCKDVYHSVLFEIIIQNKNSWFSYSHFLSFGSYCSSEVLELDSFGVKHNWKMPSGRQLSWSSPAAAGHSVWWRGPSKTRSV